MAYGMYVHCKTSINRVYGTLQRHYRVYVPYYVLNLFALSIRNAHYLNQFQRLNSLQIKAFVNLLGLFVYCLLLPSPKILGHMQKAYLHGCLMPSRLFNWSYRTVNFKSSFYRSMVARMKYFPESVFQLLPTVFFIR